MDPSARPYLSRLTRSDRHDRRPGSRRFLTAGSISFVAAAAVVAVVLVAVPWPWSNGNGSTGARNGPLIPRPPAADDAPGLSRAPEAVGTDPGVVHFDVNLPGDAEVASWMSDAAMGVESVTVSRPGRSFTFLVGRNLGFYDSEKPATDTVFDAPQSVDVTGLPGALQQTRAAGTGVSLGWTLRWRLPGGLKAVARTTGPNSAELLGFAGTVRLDAARRCVLPFSLTSVPPGMRWTVCDIRLVAATTMDVVVGSAAFVAESGGRTTEVNVELGPMTPRTDPFNRNIGGRPAVWTEGGSLEIPEFAGKLGLTVRVSGGSSGEAVAKQIAGGIKVSANRGRPETWRTRPL